MRRFVPPDAEMILRMDPAIKAAWVSALRSGYYEKGTHAMCRENNEGRLCYCPLGVLAKLLGYEAEPRGDGLYRFVSMPVDADLETQNIWLPSVAALNGWGLTHKQGLEIAERNDGHMNYCGRTMSFAEMADFIEGRTDI